MIWLNLPYYYNIVSLVESAMGPCFSLNEGRFGLQPITFSMDEEPTRNPTWQVWIILAVIVEDFSELFLRVVMSGICRGPWGTTHDNLLYYIF